MSEKQPQAHKLLLWQHRLAEKYDRQQFLEMIETYNQKLSGIWDDDFTIKGSELLTIITLGWGALFRLDRAKAINADLLAKGEDLLSVLGKDGYFPAAGKPRTEAFRVAIAKAKKG